MSASVNFTHQWLARLRVGLRPYMLISLGLHLALVIVLVIRLVVDWEPEREFVTMQLYMGDSDRPNQARGKGSVDPGGKAGGASGDQSTTSDSDADGEGSGVDWGTASDPAMEGGSRYTAQLLTDISDGDYPPRAKSMNLPNVVVGVTIYISGRTGRIRDVRIRNIRCPGYAEVPFKEDFIASARNVLLNKTRLRNKPYSADGVPRDFIWDTAITFKLTGATQ